MCGRKPAPTRRKVLTGKRALNADEPRPEPSIPDCPGHLNEIARGEWNRQAAELAPPRVLTALDRTALATYCNAYGPRVEATNKYRVMVKSPRGFPMQSPCVALANRQAEIMMRVAGEFGFTTASRSRIRVEPEEEPDLFGSS